MAMSNYLENALLQHVLANATFTSPTSLWIGLFTAAPDDVNGSGDEVPLTFAYGRVEVTGGSMFTASGTGTRSDNDALITFPAASGGSWGLIDWVGIFDTQTGGQLLLHGQLTDARQVDDTDTIEFAIGALGITFT